MAVKKNCFAYIRDGNCGGLNSMVCMCKECKFFKTTEQIEREKEKAKK